jgi:hypothetical protein
MYRWVQALRSGKILPVERVKRHWNYGDLLVGGDTYGFEITGCEGPHALMVVLSNTGSYHADSAARRRSIRRHLRHGAVGRVLVFRVNWYGAAEGAEQKKRTTKTPRHQEELCVFVTWWLKA